MDVSKKLTLAISPELEDRLLKLKKKDFYDSPWAELYRYVLERGLDAIDAASSKKKTVRPD